MHVADDIALLKENLGKMKPRGVAGTVLLYKILGAASFYNQSLDQMVELGQNILKNLFTFGLSLDSCSLPGKSKSHNL